MGFSRHNQRLWTVAISSFILFVSSSTQLKLVAEGRMIREQMNEGSAILGAQIGSRPPRCEGRCGSCGRCEAIQVPTTNTQVNSGNKNSSAAAAYGRGDDNSNYKPMSWKCKCGKYIFNP